jgi:hypothetical protein
VTAAEEPLSLRFTNKRKGRGRVVLLAPSAHGSLCIACALVVLQGTQLCTMYKGYVVKKTKSTYPQLPEVGDVSRPRRASCRWQLKCSQRDKACDHAKILRAQSADLTKAKFLQAAKAIERACEIVEVAVEV